MDTETVVCVECGKKFEANEFEAVIAMCPDCHEKENPGSGN